MRCYACAEGFGVESKDALSGVSACERHLAKLCAPKEVVVRESVLSEEEVSRGMRRLADAVKLREERFDQLTRHAIAVHPEEEERMRVAERMQRSNVVLFK